MASFAPLLSRKIAIITGGSSGIGLAATRLFLKHGAKVGVFDMQPYPDKADSDNLHFIKVDVSNEDNVNSAVADIASRWGQLDVLVNNAGVMDKMSRTADVTNEMWNRVQAINVNGPFYLTRLALRQFLKQDSRGNIVNICSVASVRGASAGAAYTASKHAMLGLSRSTAWGYAKDGIRCNTILPGGVETAVMNNVTVDEGGQQALMSYLGCMPGLCKPDNIAAGILFLATTDAVNGAELAIDHGWLTS